MSLLVCTPHLDMDRPPMRWLTAAEKRVVVAIYEANSRGAMPTPRDIAATLEMTLADVERALHVLGGRDLVRSTRPL